METTPIEVLEHHVEMLKNNYEQADKSNLHFRNQIMHYIIKFQKAIIELKNIELK